MVKFSLIRLNISNWRINPLRKHLSILGQNDPGLREIFLENSIAVILVKKLSLYNFPVKS